MNSESPNRQNYLPSVYGLNVFSEGPPVLPLWVGGSPLKKRVRSALLLKHRLRASESRCGDGKGNQHKQAERDAIAKGAGQRSPSDVTWALVLGKLDRRKAA